LKAHRPSRNDGSEGAVTTRVDVLDVPQRSDAWRQARCGRVTSSRAAAMLATVKHGEAVTHASLRAALVHEQLTGRPQDDGFVSAAMGARGQPRAPRDRRV
jgi:hypothetical protein